MKTKTGRIKGELTVRIVTYIILVILSVIFLFPFYTMITKSLMTTSEYWSPELTLVPKTFRIENYKDIFINCGVNESGVSYLLVYLFNTLKICVLGAVGLIISASLCAYGFTKINFPGRDLVFTIVLGTTMIPSSIMIIPLYSLYSKFGWINTHYPMWAGLWFGGGAINIFLVMQYMRGLPKELNECASIDGANVFRQYLQIVLPNCKPILAVISIGAIVGPWNDIQTPLMYIDEQEMYTLALGISQMRLNNEISMPSLLAACVLMTSVPLVAFVFNQRFFVESVVTSGIKG